MSDLSIVPAAVVRDILRAEPAEIAQLVRAAYLAHDRGESVSPPSLFLRFPDRPGSRIIALPAYLGALDVAGLKWISSVPANIDRDLPRASAILIINDAETGHPVGCLEAAQISAARTASSAVLAAEALTAGRRPASVAFIGCGIIAQTIANTLAVSGWNFERCLTYDTNNAHAARLASLLPAGQTVDSAEAALTGADLVVLATTQPAPHLVPPVHLRAEQTVLNISLRDLAPELIVGACNIVDDIEHCLTNSTSPHLAEQRYGHRRFICGTLADVLTGRVTPHADRPVVFSPFGLGILDLAVGTYVLRRATELGNAITVNDFHGIQDRWSA